jgi:hypothetical protein
MTISVARTITLQPPAPTPWAPYITPSLPPWPVKQPEDELDYSLDFTALLDDVGDYIASASVSMAPSGGSDAQPTLLSIYGNLVTVWIGGGVAGRTSMATIGVQTTMGRTFEMFVNIQVSLLSATWPLPAPSSTGPGPVTTQAILVAAGSYGLQTASGAYIGLAQIQA